MLSKRLVILMIVCAAIMLLALPNDAAADVKLRIYHHADAVNFMGQQQPETSDTNTVWLTSDKARMDLGDSSSFILLATDSVMYQLNHPAKEYSEIPMGEASRQVDDPEMKQIMAMLKMNVTVTPTEETLKIGEWDCRKYNVEKKMPMLDATAEMWVTKDIKIDSKAYFKAIHSTLAYFTNFEDIIKEYEKIDGVIVKESTTTRVMGQQMKSSTEVVDMTDADAPSGAYSVPDDYKLVPFQIPGMR